MHFNSAKELNRLEKEINKLLSNGMSNIYLKVTIESNWRSENFDLSPGRFFLEVQLTQVPLNFKTSYLFLTIQFYFGTSLNIFGIIFHEKLRLVACKNPSFQDLVM